MQQVQILYDKKQKRQRDTHSSLPLDVMQKSVDKKKYSTPNPLPEDTPIQRTEKIKAAQDSVEELKHIEPENRPSGRPLIETAEGDVRKLYTPQEVGRSQVQIDEEVQKEKLEDLLHQESHPIFSFRSRRFFKIFPTYVEISANRVNITSKEFFKAERKRSIEIKDINAISVDTGPLTAILRIKERSSGEITINHLQIHEAIQARRLIQGILTAKKEGIDLTKIEDPILLSKVEELGKITET